MDAMARSSGNTEGIFQIERETGTVAGREGNWAGRVEERRGEREGFKLVEVGELVPPPDELHPVDDGVTNCNSPRLAP